MVFLNKIRSHWDQQKVQSILLNKINYIKQLDLEQYKQNTDHVHADMHSLAE